MQMQMHEKEVEELKESHEASVESYEKQVE